METRRWIKAWVKKPPSISQLSSIWNHGHHIGSRGPGKSDNDVLVFVPLLVGIKVDNMSHGCARRSDGHTLYYGVNLTTGPVRNGVYDDAKDIVHNVFVVTIHFCFVQLTKEHLAALRVNAAADIVVAGIHESANGELSPAGQTAAANETVCQLHTYNR